METLRQIREDVAPFIGDSGVCSDSDEILNSVNAARRLLYRLGHWKGTIEHGIVAIYEGQMTLPYRLDYALKAWNYTGTIIDNRWWRSSARYYQCYSRYCGSEIGLSDLGDEFGSFRDNQGVKFRIKAYCDLAEDIGKVVLFHCEDEYGQRVILRRQLIQGAIGEWGGIDHGSMEDSWITRICQVTKELTVGRVVVTAYHCTVEVAAPPVLPSDEITWDSEEITWDSEEVTWDSDADIEAIVSGVLNFDNDSIDFDDESITWDDLPAGEEVPTVIGSGERVNIEFVIAIYGPDEINPHYRRYSLCGCPTWGSYSSDSLRYSPAIFPPNSICPQVVVEAKKKYVPLVNENQTVDIATEAIIHALQAVTARKNRNIPEFNTSVLLATTYLNKELAQEKSANKNRIKWQGHACNANL